MSEQVKEGKELCHILQNTAGGTALCRNQNAKGKSGLKRGRRIFPTLTKPGKDVGGGKETFSVIGKLLVTDFTTSLRAEWLGLMNYWWCPSPLCATMAMALLLPVASPY